MLHDRDNIAGHEIEPLSSNFEPVLHEVDSHVGMLANRSVVPAGLTDRVFEASVAYLPQPAARARLRLAGTNSRVFSRTVWGQLAMAASFGIAVFLFLQMSSRVVTPSNESAIVAAAGRGEAATWFASDSVDAVGREVGFLLQTNNVDSYDDMTFELSMLLVDHEM